MEEVIIYNDVIMGENKCVTIYHTQGATPDGTNCNFYSCFRLPMSKRS